MKIYGIDFTSAPKRDKPVVVADCDASERQLTLKRFIEFSDWPAFDLWLSEDEEWVGGFDFPFGLPRRFVNAQGWPGDWPGMVKACVRGGKARFVDAAMRAFVGARSVEDKHRKTDLAARSHSPLKTRTNPPVGLMFYEGASRLVAHDIHVPELNETRSRKIALEAYPGFAISRLGERYYKNDTADSAKKNLAARKRVLDQLKNRSSDALSCSVVLADKALLGPLLHASGDWLDAVLCATQAHWSWQRKDSHFGLPRDVDPVEGWIVSA